MFVIIPNESTPCNRTVADCVCTKSIVLGNILKHCLDDCGSSLEATNYTQNFTSPGYPNDYMNNLNCEWKITARPGYFVHLVFIDFQTELLFDQVLVRILCVNNVNYQHKYSLTEQ